MMAYELVVSKDDRRRVSTSTDYLWLSLRDIAVELTVYNSILGSPTLLAVASALHGQVKAQAMHTTP